MFAVALDIAEAKEEISKHGSGLVFLDVEMPFGNGFDLLESLDKIDFEVVFVTAFSITRLRLSNIVLVTI